MKKSMFHSGKKLSTVLRNEYFRSIIYPLLIIEATLLIAYFWSNSYVNDATQETLVEETKINLSEISKHTSEVIERDFETISQTAQLFRKRHEEFFSSYELSSNHENKGYFVTSDGVIVNHPETNETCTLFYSNVHADDASRLNKAVATGILDKFYNDVLKTNTNIVQVYFNSYDSMNRLCPVMNDPLNQYPHDINIPNYNFYYLADAKHNPDKKVVWTDAYLDPAGQGWMISAIAPVYRERFLEGVVGIDITLDKILNNILSIQLPYTSYAILVDQSGKIIAMNPGLESILGIKEMTKHRYDKPVTETISKPDNFNLLSASDNHLVKHLGEIFKDKKAITECNTNSQRFLVTQNTIHQTGWRLMILVDENSLFENSINLKKQTDKIGYIILLFMAVFYLVFVFMIIRRSRVFSQEILDPMEALISATNRLRRDLIVFRPDNSKIYEIDLLIDNFTAMGEDLSHLYKTMQFKIDDGIAKNLETQKMMIYQSRLAAMGEMVTMLAHQWRQPIHTMALEANNVYMDLELGTLDEKNLKYSIEKMLVLIQKLSKTIDEFRAFFQTDNQSKEMELGSLIDNALAIIAQYLEEYGIRIEHEYSRTIRFETYPREMAQVLVNLLKNSKEAFEHNNVNVPFIRIAAEEGETFVTLKVEDNAGGVPEAIREKIFDPYFSTKANMNGSGLGLYVVMMVVEKHLHGKITEYNTGSGACFEITFPKRLAGGEG